MNYKFEATYKLAKVAVNLGKQQKIVNLAVLSPMMFDQTIVAAFEHVFDGTLVLSMKNVKGRFHRFFRVKKSPISSFRTDEAPYEIVDNRPCLAI
jgi:archaellum biogenesis ATPase FlaH